MHHHHACNHFSHGPKNRFRCYANVCLYFAMQWFHIKFRHLQYRTSRSLSVRHQISRISPTDQLGFCILRLFVPTLGNASLRSFLDIDGFVWNSCFKKMFLHVMVPLGSVTPPEPTFRADGHVPHINLSGFKELFFDFDCGITLRSAWCLSHFEKNILVCIFVLLYVCMPLVTKTGVNYLSSPWFMTFFFWGWSIGVRIRVCTWPWKKTKKKNQLKQINKNKNRKKRKQKKNKAKKTKNEKKNNRTKHK